MPNFNNVYDRYIDSPVILKVLSCIIRILKTVESSIATYAYLHTIMLHIFLQLRINSFAKIQHIPLSFMHEHYSD